MALGGQVGGEVGTRGAAGSEQVEGWWRAAGVCSLMGGPGRNTPHRPQLMLLVKLAEHGDTPQMDKKCRRNTSQHWIIKNVVQNPLLCVLPSQRTGCSREAP